MPANVRSFEAIHAVRAALASFRDELDQALATIDVEMRRVLDWLEHDRPRFWRIQLREANDAVTQARADLHRCLMYPINDERPSCTEERAALKQAESRLVYCDEKSQRLRHWSRQVRHEMFEYEGRIGQLRELIEIDTPHAVGVIDRLLARLHEYQSLRAPHADTATPPDGLAASAASESFARDLMPEPTATPPSKPASAPASPAEESP